MRRAQQAARKIVDDTPVEDLIEMLFEQPTALEGPQSKKFCVFASACDEQDFLPVFLDHYRATGVEHFYLVDDGSKVPISDLDLGPDVTSVRPVVGDFKTSKGLWLGALSKYIVPERDWMLTVDIDELVQLPKPFTSFKELTRHLDNQGADFAPGVLLDLLPSESVTEGDKAIDYHQVFDSFCWNETPVEESYQANSSVQWAFGDRAELSWRIDARYHAFGTLDSLRKIPLLRQRSGWHLNEGFHTLYATGKSAGPQPTAKIFEQPIILPVFHYKLSRLWTDKARQRMLEILDHYDPVTRKQIHSYFDAEDGVEKLSGIKRHLRPKEDALETQLFATAAQPTVQRTQKPFAIFALQRTGGTNLAHALERRSNCTSAVDHEPFLSKRVYGHLLSDWKEHKDRARLQRGMAEILSKSINIKHCFEVVPAPVNDALISCAEDEGYRFLFLYRENAAARILSAEFARRSDIWGPRANTKIEGEDEIFAQPLDVEKLLAKETNNIMLANALWKRVNNGKNTAIAISFEQIYGEDREIASASVQGVLNALQLSQGPVADQDFVDGLRSRGNQGTRNKYARFRGYVDLVDGAKTLPKVNF